MIFSSVDLEKYHCTAEHDKSGIDTSVLQTRKRPQVYPDKSVCHFPIICNQAISLACICSYSSRIKNASTVVKYLNFSQ